MFVVSAYCNLLGFYVSEFKRGDTCVLITYTWFTIDWRDRRLMSNLYLQQEAIIRVGNGYSKVQTSIHRQRAAVGLPTFTYTLSNIFGNDDGMEEIEEGIKVGGKLVKDVRFADDQEMLQALKEVYKS